MPRLRDNVLANYAGQVWVAAMGVVFVPLYLKKLGAEQFGLVAFMLSLQTISLLLDLGVSAFLGREIAQRAHDSERRETIKGLVRSFEWLVWPTALMIGVIIYLASGPLSTHWLRPQRLDISETIEAVQIMALSVALLWPTSFYTAALSGLERQPQLNLLLAVCATLRFGGVVPVLFFTKLGIHGFLWWHAFVALIQTIWGALLLWRNIPPSARPSRFDVMEIGNARHFALGVFAVTATGMLLTQMDRIAISSLRPLQEFGYYAVALSISGGLGRLVVPTANAVYPRLSRLAACSDTPGLTNLYHLASQIVTVLVAALAALICIYPDAVLLLWTNDPTTVKQAALPLSLLFGGSALSGALYLPYILQLAHGRTKLSITINLTTLAIAVPLYIVATRTYGAAGAAASWLAINIGQLLIGPAIMHRHLLKGELARWHLQDIWPSTVSAFAVTIIARWACPHVERTLTGLAWLTFIAVLALLAAAMASNGVRALVMNALKSASTSQHADYLK